MKQRISIALVVAAITVLLVVVGVAYALTITMDGQHNPANEWGANPGTCTIGSTGCSRIVDDPVDVSGPPTAYYDIKDVLLTNNASNLYMNIDFYGAGPTWEETVPSRPVLTICFDIDANTATGGTLGAGNCNGTQAATGVDRFIRIFGQAGGLPTAPQVFSWNGSAFVSQGTGVIGYNPGLATGITEIGIALTDLGYVAGSHTCPISGLPQPCAARMNMFFDNGVAASDDSVPDMGTTNMTFGCDVTGAPCSPTAVTLESLSASTPQTETATLILITTGVIALGVVGGLVVRRKRHAA